MSSIGARSSATSPCSILTSSHRAARNTPETKGFQAQGGAHSREKSQPTREPRGWSIARPAASRRVAPVPDVGLLAEYGPRQDGAAGPDVAHCGQSRRAYRHGLGGTHDDQLAVDYGSHPSATFDN